MTTVSECQESIDRINGEVSVVCSTIDRLTDKKNNLLNQITTLQENIKKLTELERLNDFISGKRRGILWHDPWSNDYCEYIEKNGSIMSVKVNEKIFNIYHLL